MAAAVSATSTLRLVSGPRAELSGNPAFVEGVGPPEELGTGAGVDGCAAGPLKATGCANEDGEVMIAGTGTLATEGALWRPTE